MNRRTLQPNMESKMMIAIPKNTPACSLVATAMCCQSLLAQTEWTHVTDQPVRDYGTPVEWDAWQAFLPLVITYIGTGETTRARKSAAVFISTASSPVTIRNRARCCWWSERTVM